MKNYNLTALIALTFIAQAGYGMGLPGDEGAAPYPGVTAAPPVPPVDHEGASEVPGGKPTAPLDSLCPAVGITPDQKNPLTKVLAEVAKVDLPPKFRDAVISLASQIPRGHEYVGKIISALSEVPEERLDEVMNVAECLIKYCMPLPKDSSLNEVRVIRALTEFSKETFDAFRPVICLLGSDVPYLDEWMLCLKRFPADRLTVNFIDATQKLMAVMGKQCRHEITLALGDVPKDRLTPSFVDAAVALTARIDEPTVSGVGHRVLHELSVSGVSHRLLHKLLPVIKALKDVPEDRLTHHFVRTLIKLTDGMPLYNKISLIPTLAEIPEGFLTDRFISDVQALWFGMSTPFGSTWIKRDDFKHFSMSISMVSALIKVPEGSRGLFIDSAMVLSHGLDTYDARVHVVYALARIPEKDWDAAITSAHRAAAAKAAELKSYDPLLNLKKMDAMMERLRAFYGVSAAPPPPAAATKAAAAPLVLSEEEAAEGYMRSMGMDASGIDAVKGLLTSRGREARDIAYVVDGLKNILVLEKYKLPLAKALASMPRERSIEDLVSGIKSLFPRPTPFQRHLFVSFFAEVPTEISIADVVQELNKLPRGMDIDGKVCHIRSLGFLVEAAPPPPAAATEAVVGLDIFEEVFAEQDMLNMGLKGSAVAAVKENLEDRKRPLSDMSYIVKGIESFALSEPKDISSLASALASLPRERVIDDVVTGLKSLNRKDIISRVTFAFGLLPSRIKITDVVNALNELPEDADVDAIMDCICTFDGDE